LRKPGGDLERHTLDLNDPFFSMQVFSVLENNGKMDPEKLDDYIARDGYKALRKALTMSARRYARRCWPAACVAAAARDSRPA